MDDKLIRTIAKVVIISCLFCGGILFGIIFGLLTKVGNKFDETKNFLESAEGVMAINEPLSDLPETDALYKPFWETWKLLHYFYVDQPLDENALMEGAIRGMLESLGDQHTRYADPRGYSEEKDSISGQYQGIGAYVDVSGEYVEIISAIPGGPAEEVGLRPKDLIIALNGEDVTGTPPTEVQPRLLGEAGTTITLTIKRGDQDPFEVEITRRVIDTPMAEGKMLDDGIAYVQLTQFGDHTTEELRKALDTLMKEDPKGLILDLRNNGGGYLESAVEVAGEFLPVGTLVLSEIEGSGRKTEYFVEKGGARALDVPMVVLINGGTASASEIVTGALSQNDRCTVIGELSYGKGSVQIQFPLSNDGAVSVTIGRWYTPNGTLVHGVGITPDIEVKLTEEDVMNERDPQLDAAVSFLAGNSPQNEKMDDN